MALRRRDVSNHAVARGTDGRSRRRARGRNGEKTMVVQIEVAMAELVMSWKGVVRACHDVAEV